MQLPSILPIQSHRVSKAGGAGGSKGHAVAGGSTAKPSEANSSSTGQESGSTSAGVAGVQQIGQEDQQAGASGRQHGAGVWVERDEIQGALPTSKVTAWHMMWYSF